LIAGASGVAALVGLAGTVQWSMSSMNLSGVQGKEERVGMVPSFPACSAAGENCMDTGCCKVSGHTCYVMQDKNGQSKAQCNETCNRGSCLTINPHSVPVAQKLGQRLYCFAVYTKNTGNLSKPNTELELLQFAKSKSGGVFACDVWEVYSDTANVAIGDYTAIQVEDKNNEFYQVKRKETGCWVNWALFYQVWVKIAENGKWAQADWTVKVDPDAVFLPDRLRTYLANKVAGDSPHGLYLENCPNVQYGFFGHIEVISKTGAQVLTSYLDECHDAFAPCANDGCDWKWGAWGEDVFIQRCMDHHYVDKVEAYDLATDGACKADRPAGEKKNSKWYPKDCSGLTTATAHPLKKPQAYKMCFEQMAR